MYFAPLMAIALGGLDPQRMAFGSGLANFFRTTAGSFGASLVTTFWERREAVHHTQLVSSITPYAVPVHDTLRQLRGTGLDAAQGLGELSAMLAHQSTLLARSEER